MTVFFNYIIWSLYPIYCIKPSFSLIQFGVGQKIYWRDLRLIPSPTGSILCYFTMFFHCYSLACFIYLFILRIEFFYSVHWNHLMNTLLISLCRIRIDGQPYHLNSSLIFLTQMGQKLKASAWKEVKSKVIIFYAKIS